MKKYIKIVLCLALCSCVFCSCSNDNTQDIKTDVTNSALSKYQGESVSNSYENKYLCLGFNLPEKWRFYTDKEIEKIFGVAKSSVSEETNDIMDSSSYFFDMCATSADLKSSVNVVIEEKTEGTMGLSPQKLAQNAAKLVKSEYEKIYDSSDIEQKEIKIGEKTYFGYDVKCEYEKMPLYQRAFLIDTENHVATITITAVSSEELDIMIKSFYNI